MNTLRIVLIIIGVIFIVGMYFFQKKSILEGDSRQRFFGFLPFAVKSFNKTASMTALVLAKIKIISKKLFGAKKEIVLTSEPVKRSFEQLSKEQLASMSSMVANKISGEQVTKAISIESGQTQSQPVTVSKGEELLIALTVIPKPGCCFTGDEIILACQSAGLQLGEFNIFHRYALIDDKVQIIPVCSLVNLFEPGYFELDIMSEFATEGLSLFMQLPGPVDGREAFIILMDVSEKLSLNLNATICDETRSVLTTQTISHLKEKVENYRFKLRMESLKNH